MSTQPGHLYLVSTPIGNLEDISLRALNVLKTVNIIATEDTRHSGVLMKHYGVNTPLLSLHQHNEKQRSVVVVRRLLAGESVALISDAGTPLFSDPGYHLVSLAIENGVKVTPVPGACAAVSALVSSGLSTEHFIFDGFLPSKGMKREKAVEALSTETRTIVLYESVHRILDLLFVLKKYFGADRRVCLAREITKRFETIHTTSIEKWIALMESHPEKIKGEYVVVIEGAEITPRLEVDAQVEKMLRVLLLEMPLKQAVSIAVKLTGLRKKILYDKALTIQNEMDMD